MPPTFRPRGERTKRERDQAHDRQRGSAAVRGYDGRWAKAAKGHLAHAPLCRYCESGAWGDAPRVTAAVLVDHLYPHRGDRALFWARRWWVSACKACHDGPKQRAERAGEGALARLAGRLGLPAREGAGAAEG